MGKLFRCKGITDLMSWRVGKGGNLYWHRGRGRTVSSVGMGVLVSGGVNKTSWWCDGRAVVVKREGSRAGVYKGSSGVFMGKKGGGGEVFDVDTEFRGV